MPDPESRLVKFKDSRGKESEKTSRKVRQGKKVEREKCREKERTCDIEREGKRTEDN